MGMGRVGEGKGGRSMMVGKTVALGVGELGRSQILLGGWLRMSG
jgi:hypothetical protein